MARHFSMIRSFAFADLITLGNGMAGTGSIFASLKSVSTGNRDFLWLAMGLLPLAMVFDFLDGRVARWRQKGSALGAQLDSLADLISFGVAPAVIAYDVGMRGGWDAVILVYFVSCGLSRLARYNITAASMSDESGKVRYFEGTPIPTSVVLVMVLAVLVYMERIDQSLPFGFWNIGPWELHPLVLMFFLSGCAMISATLKIPKV
ncbi:MAG: CDP-alcohol phosphatidyltransferase family protein [Myxococcota bacterium]